MGFDVGLKPGALERLTHLSRAFDEELNRTPDRHAAYVGASAFAHKGGLHVSAVAKDPSIYEHIDPALVGNERDILVSDQAGRSNLLHRFAEMGLAIEPTAEQTTEILGAIKQREAEGYAYDAAAASFAVLVRRTLGDLPDYFRLSSFRVIIEHRFNARGEQVTISEATIKGAVAGRAFYKVAEGNGPVNALDHAMRDALKEVYAGLESMSLLDYKVRILDGENNTAATTRVLIETRQGTRRWSTVGASPNIIDASWRALADSMEYALVH